MAKRIGKYKITKRESALNLTDGGTVNGALTITGVVKFSDTTTVEAAGASLTNNQVYWTSSLGVTASALQVLVMG